MPLYRQPKSPFWWVRIQVAGAKIRRSSGTTDRAEAEEFEQGERDRLWRIHKLGDRSATPFNEAAARWLTETKKRSKEKDRALLEWFCGQPELREAPLSSVDFDSIQILRQLLADEGKSPATIDRYMACLRALLRKAALEWRLIPSAPKVPMYNEEQEEPVYLTRPQLERLLAELPLHLALAAEFAVYTGLRMRAQLKLTWDRVDLDARRAWIRGSQQKGKKTLGIPLSREAVRVLRRCKEAFPTGNHCFQYDDVSARVLSPVDIRATCSALVAQGRVSYLRLVAELRARYGCVGKTSISRAIWVEVCGRQSRTIENCPPVEVTAPEQFKARPTHFRPIDDCNTAAFKAAVARAGLDPAVVNWHTLRHTFASWAVQNGVSLQELMQLGGWKSYAMVLRYAHLAPDHLSQAAEKVAGKRHTEIRGTKRRARKTA